MISFPQLFPGSILLPRVSGVDGRRPCNTASHARPGPILSVFFALIVHSELKGSTSVERRQWSAVSGAPSMERELIERCVGRAPSVER